MQTVIRAILYDAFMVFDFFYYYIGSKKQTNSDQRIKPFVLIKMIIIKPNS
jgi:hypothetical protein